MLLIAYRYEVVHSVRMQVPSVSHIVSSPVNQNARQDRCKERTWNNAGIRTSSQGP